MKINGLMIRVAIIAIVLILALAGGVVTFFKDSLTSQATLPFVDENNKAVVLQNNGSAKDPTFSQVVDFLRSDNTEQLGMDAGPALKRVHDRAEAQGIKAGVFVYDMGLKVDKVNYVDAYVVFHTTDRGTIYTDSTGLYGEVPDDYIFLYNSAGAGAYTTYYIPLENYTKMSYPVTLPMSSTLMDETGTLEDSTKMSNTRTIW